MKTCPEEVKTATGVKDTRKQREGYKKKKILKYREEIYLEKNTWDIKFITEGQGSK